MGYRFFGFDYWYLIFCVPALILSLFASFHVKSTFNKYSKVPSKSGMNSTDAVRLVLNSNDCPMIPVQMIGGELTDHFDPSSNTISLSQSVAGMGTSVASLGVAAHESGHAVQFAKNYPLMNLRSKLVPVANIGSSAGIWLAILGLLFAFRPLVLGGVILYMGFVLFELVTLPVEINASRRGYNALAECGRMSQDELAGVKKVLSAAALTYVAALASSLGQLLRLIMLMRGNNRNS